MGLTSCASPSAPGISPPLSFRSVGRSSKWLLATSHSPHATFTRLEYPILGRNQRKPISKWRLRIASPSGFSHRRHTLLTFVYRAIMDRLGDSSDHCRTPWALPDPAPISSDSFLLMYFSDVIGFSALNHPTAPVAQPLHIRLSRCSQGKRSRFI